MYATSRVLAGLDFFGRTEVLLVIDGEPAIKALADAVRILRDRKTLIEVVPRYSSPSKGIEETINGLIEGDVLVICLRIHDMLDVTAALGWIIRHAGWLWIRFAVHIHGFTSYQSLRGRIDSGKIAEFGECVFACSPEAQVTPLKTARLEARWQKAVWFGKTDQSDEHIVVDKDGWRTCRTVARRPEDKRWNKKFFATVNVRSYEAARVATLKDAADEAGSRRRYLTRTIVGEYGASQHCKACADGVGTHTAECRARLERFIAESEAEKLTAAADTLAPAAVDAAAAGEVDVPMSSGARGSNDPMEVAAAPAQEEMQIDLTADLVADQAGTTRIADA